MNSVENVYDELTQLRSIPNVIKSIIGINNQYSYTVYSYSIYDTIYVDTDYCTAVVSTYGLQG